MKKLMDINLEFVTRRIKEAKESIQKDPQVRLNNPEDAKEGFYDSQLSHEYGALAVNGFLAYGDVEGFRENMCRSAELYVELYKRYENGEPVSYGYIQPNSNIIANVLSAGNFELGKKISELMLKHDQYKIDDVFYVVSGILLHKPELFEEWLAKTYKNMAKSRKSFYGRPVALEGIWRKDADKVVEGVNFVLSKYNRLSATSYNLSIYKYLAVFEISLIHLAYARGLQFEIPDSPYLPKALVLPPEEIQKLIKL